MDRGVVATLVCDASLRGGTTADTEMNIALMPSACSVEFCRNNCPPLPADAEVWRASGLVPCETCGLALDDHQQFAYPSGMRHVVLGCDGRYYHL